MTIRIGRILGALALATVLAAAPAAHAQGDARYINPSGLTKPTGYTHVVVAADGRTVHIAGQVAFDSTGALVGAGDFPSSASAALNPVASLSVAPTPQ